MRSKLGLIAMMAAFAEMSSDPFNNKERSNPKLDTPNPKPPIPNGCKEFWFRSNGEITEYLDMTVFKCTAINLRNAERKFKSWKRQQ